jgi:hypothetical protein
MSRRSPLSVTPWERRVPSSTNPALRATVRRVIVRLDVELHPLDREFREGVLAGKPHCADRETASSTRGEDPVRHLGDAVIAEPDLAAADGLAAVRVAGGKRPRAPPLRHCLCQRRITLRTLSSVECAGYQPKRRACSSSSPASCEATSPSVNASSTRTPSLKRGAIEATHAVSPKRTLRACRDRKSRFAPERP